MDLQNNVQPESARMEQIVSQFFLKTLHIVLDSRVPSFRPRDHSADQRRILRAKKSDKWFSLILGDRPAALDSLHLWHRNVVDPMIIDIVLVQNPSLGTVIERWVVQYEPARLMANQVGDSAALYKKTYKRLIILLRSLYATMRLLPAHRIFQQLSSLTQTYDFDIQYKVSSFTDPFSREDDRLMEHCRFVPVEALPGRLCVSVSYRSDLAGFNLQPLVSVPPKIITDYVGSPATEPLRAFSSSDKGWHPTSFPVRGLEPRTSSSSSSQRPHSWTSGLHRAAPLMHSQSLGSSPPTYHTSPRSFDSPSPSPDIYGNKPQNCRPSPHLKSTSYDEYQLSPPFSPSPSPSPPSYLLNGNPVHNHLRSGSAPVSIPFPMIGRGLKHLSPNSSDPSRQYPPPLSPKSTKRDPSSQYSPSGNRSFRKAEGLRTGESYSGVTKVFRDNKDDSGRFSGLLSSSGSPRIGFSRSSSRLSFQDDLDDGDFSCPFAVDDVDTPENQASQNYVGKSQDAAVGALVRMLRTAPPLRQDPSCYSLHSCKTAVEGDVASASGFLMPRKAADALEELKSFREMKDLLLSKSGARVFCHEEN